MRYDRYRCQWQFRLSSYPEYEGNKTCRGAPVVGKLPSGAGPLPPDSLVVKRRKPNMALERKRRARTEALEPPPIPGL